MSVFKTKEWELVDLTCYTVIHQDSKTRPEWETIKVALLRDPCAIHHATDPFIHKLVKMQLSLQTKTKFSVL